MRSKTNCLLAVAVAGLMLESGCSQQVQTGEIVSCKHCKKEVSNTVAVIKVPTSKAKDYRVNRSETYCQQCGDDDVGYQITTTCQTCRSKKVDVAHAKRRTEPKDLVKTVKFCECGDELVAYKRFLKCLDCGKPYNSETLTAARRTQPRDETTTAGYCSRSCERIAKVGKASEEIGKTAGQIFNSLSSGLKQRLNR
jgi:hypothetical protein